jgi:hypothetical protein
MRGIVPSAHVAYVSMSRRLEPLRWRRPPERDPSHAGILQATQRLSSAAVSVCDVRRPTDDC